jgi:hypothetical protein
MALTATATEAVRKVLKYSPCSHTTAWNEITNFKILCNLQDIVGTLRVPNALVLKEEL